MVHFTSERLSVLPGQPEKLSLETKAYREIRHRLVSGSILPGSVLSENELADQLAMSRTPIRAAISLLEKEGFLESIQGRGVFVKEISFQAFYEMFEMLVSMQVYALEIAGKRGLSFDMAALKTHLDLQIRAAEEGDYSSYYENSLLFVETMIAAVKNQSMLQAFEQIKGKYLFKIVSHRKLNADTLSKPRQAKDAHSRIYEALLRGDLEAAKTAVYEINDMLYRHIHLIDI